MEDLLRLLEQDCTYSVKQLATMLDKQEDEIKNEILKFEENNTILGYKALVDWDKTDREFVTALIELKVAPVKDMGFDKVAQRISNFPQVQSVYLMSGGFDVAVIIEGRTLKEVSLFVARKLSTMEGVTATRTHFVLKKYKDKGSQFDELEDDKRGIQ